MKTSRLIQFSFAAIALCLPQPARGQEPDARFAARFVESVKRAAKDVDGPRKTTMLIVRPHKKNFQRVVTTLVLLEKTVPKAHFYLAHYGQPEPDRR